MVAIVLAGFGFATGSQNRDVMLARLDASGGLDSSFAGGGIVVHTYGALDVQQDKLAIGPGNIPVAIAILADNDVLVTTQKRLLRYDNNGTPDPMLALAAA